MASGFGHTARQLSFTYGRGASDASLLSNYNTDPTVGGSGMNVNFVRLEKEIA
jgi:thiosulfate reductase / polysulfide reductase chain A